MSNDTLISLVDDEEEEVQLVDGCRLYRKEEDITPTTFKGTTVVQSNDTEKDVDTDERKKKKRRRRKRSKEEDSWMIYNKSKFMELSGG